MNLRALSKLIRVLLWKAFKAFPDGLRGHFTRLMFSASISKDDNNFTFKIADTKEEVLQALELVQSNYRRLEMTDSDELMRISKFNFMPTTTIFIAKSGEEVVGTISVILDSHLKLPIDNFNNVNDFRGLGVIGEFSCLTVGQKWRSRNTGISLPLALLALDYCLNTLQLDYIFLTIRKSVVPFYTDICGFELFGDTKKHSGVNNLKSSSLVVDKKTYLTRLEELYGNAPLEKNLYRLLKTFPWGKPKDLIEKRSLIAQKVFFSDGFYETLKSSSSALSNLTEMELKTVDNSLNLSSLDETLENGSILTHRKSYRFSVNLKSNIIAGRESFQTRVLDVSDNGVCLFMDANENSIVIFDLILDTKKIRAKGYVCWKFSNRVGVKLVKPSSEWRDFIKSLDQELFGHIEEDKKAA